METECDNGDTESIHTRNIAEEYSQILPDWMTDKCWELKVLYLCYMGNVFFLFSSINIKINIKFLILLVVIYFHFLKKPKIIYL